MLRHLRITDLPTLIKLRRSSTHGLAYPAKPAILGIIRSFSLLRYFLLIIFFRDWRNCWIEPLETRNTGVIRVQPRVSGTAWEVIDLFTIQLNSGAITNLLDDISGPAIQSGALKILIRIPQDKDIFIEVRKAGFRPLWGEIVYKLPSNNLKHSDFPQQKSAAEWCQLTNFDKERAFRLFCSETPVFARSILGPTINDWLSYEETLPEPNQDLCVKGRKSEELSSRLSISTMGEGRFFKLISKYDYKNSLKDIIMQVMGETEIYPLYTMVNDYESNLIATLERFGFLPFARYDLMIKTLTERVHTRKPLLVSARH